MISTNNIYLRVISSFITRFLAIREKLFLLKELPPLEDDFYHGLDKTCGDRRTLVE